MTSERFDHAPIVKAWLDEPIGLPEGDTGRVAQLVHQTPQQRGWLRRIFTERTTHMYTATKFVTAGVIIAAAGGFLLYSGGLLPQTNESLPAASVDASAEPLITAEPVITAEPAITAEPSDTVEGTLVMEAPQAPLSVAGWTQVGAAPFTNPDGSGFAQLSKLHVVGDTLVAFGAYSPDVDAEISSPAVFHSADGQTWDPVFIPGTKPVLNDMAATDEGLILGGHDRVDGERKAKLWSSTDGLEWVEVPAPDGAATISQIVSAQDPLAVRANQRMYRQEEDGTWTDLDRIPNSQILRGPSGYITWQGGGQDRRFQLTMFHQEELGGEIREIGLPGKLGRGDLAQIGVQLFVVGDQWVMVPDGVDTPIYVSSDGFDWQPVPRPDRMLGGFVFWMEMVGDQLQAYGIQFRKNVSPSGIWTIDLSSAEPAPFEMLDRQATRHLTWVVPFGDGYFATGIRTAGANGGLSTWQHEATQ
jgi:hypothetical protein